MTAQSPFRKDRVYKKQVNMGGVVKEVELSQSVLKEALDPALSTEYLWIPPFNATLSNKAGKASVLVPKKDGRTLMLMFLTPYYEDKLYAIAQPILDEINSLLSEFQEKGGVKGIDWGVDLGDLVQGIFMRLTGAIHDFNRTCAKTAAIIAEASIVLERKYKDEEITDEDRQLIQKLNEDYFMENVPSDYTLKGIILPQYKKTGVADLIQVFFSNLKDAILSGVGSLIQAKTTLPTSSTPDSSKVSADFQPSVTSMQEPS